MSLLTYLQAVPKVELHVHLEGAIQPRTLLTIARRNHVSLPADSIDGLRRWFTFQSFAQFVDVYVAVTRCLRTAQDYELIVYEFAEELARQNVRYAEVTFSPGTHFRLGVAHDVYFLGLSRGRKRAQADFDITLNWVFDIVRDADARLADYTTRVAIEGKNDGVVALGLGGFELGHPPETFARYFDIVLAAGLHSAPHAGETAGPSSVWGALRALGAERIGHGVRAAEDPALIAYLVEHAVPLEVCPTGNIRLGVYPTFATHPLRRLQGAGITVTINSDDPVLFNTTLNEEVALLAGQFNFDVKAINNILLNAVRNCFQPSEQKRALETAFRAQYDKLWAQHSPK